jgi:signal transduction histidine kinase
MLRNRLKWFLFYRLIIAILGLGAILIYHLGQSPFFQRISPAIFPPHILSAYLTLVFACLINVVYLFLIKYFSPTPNTKDADVSSGDSALRKLALIQIGIDILIETLLSYFTGGSGSIFASLYFASILAANIMVSARSGLFFASLSSTLLSVITIMYSLSAAGKFNLPLLPPEFVKSSAQGFRFILPYLFFFILILHFVAYSAGRLVNELALERQLKNELARRTEMLEVLKEMSIGIAHELRNPLAAIKGAVQGLAQSFASPRTTDIKRDEQKLITTVIKETDRLNRIISNFLDFARERPTLLQPVNLTEILQEVTLLAKQGLLVQDRKNKADFTITMDAPPVIRCKIDSEQIKQVLYNLIHNGIEASPNGGKILVKAYLLPAGSPPLRKIQSLIAIEVIDYGEGIAPEHHKKIFEPFFTTKSQGIGLGLAIAHRIIKAHQGEIMLESALSKGSKFTILLPQN